MQPESSSDSWLLKARRLVGNYDVLTSVYATAGTTPNLNTSTGALAVSSLWQSLLFVSEATNPATAIYFSD
jgi:hypothetical protein